MSFDKYIVTKVSWCYYMERMTQEQIADYVGISRFKVIKMLEQARAENIVQFRISGSGVNCLKIEQALKKQYNLKDALVIPAPPQNLADSISQAAAQYIVEKTKDKDVIGFGWGMTVSRTIGEVNSSSKGILSFVSLTGGVKYYIPYNGSLHGRPAQKRPENSSGKLYIIPAPFYMSSEDMAVRTYNEPSVKVIFDLAKTANHILVGIGSITENATVLQENIITIDQMEILKRKGAVGDILGQFFDKDGNKLDADIHTRIMAVDINRLKGQDNVIGVAGGDRKIKAIRGALQGGYLNTLITDESTAQQLIN